MKPIIRFAAALALLLALAPAARAQTPMLKGSAAGISDRVTDRSVAVTNCTAANPTVCTFANNSFLGLTAGDPVLLKGASNVPDGVYPCNSPTGTTCTLTGATGTGAFTSNNAKLALLGAITNGSSDYFDCTRCITAAIFVYSTGTSAADVAVEGTSAPIKSDAKGFAATPWSQLRSIHFPDSGAAGNGFVIPSLPAKYFRVTVSNYSTGTMYAVLTGTDVFGNAIW